MTSDSQDPAPSSTRPLAGVRVLIPRAPGRGDGLAAMVDAAGGHAIVAPMISRADVDESDRGLLDAAVRDLGSGAFGWVAITSVNAVAELAAAAARTGTRLVPPPAPAPAAAGEVVGRRGQRRVRWAAVGPATQRALADVGVVADLVAAENSAVGMLAEWPAAGRHGASRRRGEENTRSIAAADAAAGRRVLLPLGDLAEPTLEKGLTELGFDPVRVTTYRTVAHPAPPEVISDWTAGRIDVVVLTSGSVAREVAKQLGPRADVAAVAIGEPTRRAAEGTGQPVAAVAASATDEALFDAILEATASPTTPEPGTPTLPEDQ